MPGAPTLLQFGPAGAEHRRRGPAASGGPEVTAGPRRRGAWSDSVASVLPSCMFRTPPSPTSRQRPWPAVTRALSRGLRLMRRDPFSQLAGRGLFGQGTGCRYGDARVMPSPIRRSTKVARTRRTRQTVIALSTTEGRSRPGVEVPTATPGQLVRRARLRRGSTITAKGFSFRRRAAAQS